MSDLDPDFDPAFSTAVSTLVNAAVDRELAGRRVAPPFDRTGSSGGSGRQPRRLVGWTGPALAAAVAALLLVGSIVAIDHGRGRRSATVAGPAPSVSRSADPDLSEAARAFAAAVAGAREASEVPGVSVGPISESDAARFADSGLWTMPGPAPATPVPGHSYSVTVRYVVGYHTDKDGHSPTDGVTVVSGELRDAAAGSCPPPFLARPGHTYLIDCQVTFRPGAAGSVAFTDRNPDGFTGATFGLSDPAEPSASPSISTSPSPDPNEAARVYAEALAGAPEASAVPGVSDRPAPAQRSTGMGVGFTDATVVNPARGKSYPLTLIYTPGTDDPPLAVLTIRFEDVAAGHCPGPFRGRTGHTYRLQCQVTFRPGTEGRAYYTATGPNGADGVGVALNLP
ncbi:MAG: hypothetical protein JO144_08915 [Actinobacteria bacterium]|nr:hypothetical protein [Actinomycetota bacterium]